VIDGGEVSKNRRADDRTMFRLVLGAFAVLAVLNCADVVLTRIVVAKVGAGAESNGVARAMLSGYRPEIIKLVVLSGLIWRTVTRPRVTAAWLAAVYSVVGVYAVTVFLNYQTWNNVG
jgi:Na+/proline symporter